MAQKELRAADLCRRTGVAPSVVSEWLSGRIPANIQNLHKIGLELGVSMDALCFGDHGASSATEAPSQSRLFSSPDRIPAQALFPLSVMLNDGSALYEIHIKRVEIPPSPKEHETPRSVAEENPALNLE
jgi:transcriptional regulator with XRE-family HTH domain